MIDIKRGKEMTRRDFIGGGIAAASTLGIAGSANATVRRGLGARLAANFAGGGGGVEYVDWVMSDGSAWIDSGWDCTSVDSFSYSIELSYGSVFSQGYVFGAISTNSPSVIGFAVEYVGMFSQHIDRRFCQRNSQYDDDWYQWENPAYTTDSIWGDGLFHTFSVNKTIASRKAPVIKLDGNTLATANMFRGMKSTSPITVGVFAAKCPDGVGRLKYSASTALKIRRLTILDMNDVTVLDLRAAKNGSEYGLYDDVAGVFHGGIDGTITGA